MFNGRGFGRLGTGAVLALALVAAFVASALGPICNASSPGFPTTSAAPVRTRLADQSDFVDTIATFLNSARTIPCAFFQPGSTVWFRATTTTFGNPGDNVSIRNNGVIFGTIPWVGPNTYESSIIASGVNDNVFILSNKTAPATEKARYTIDTTPPSAPTYVTSQGLTFATPPTLDINFADNRQIYDITYFYDGAPTPSYDIVRGHTSATFATDWTPTWGALPDGNHTIWFNVTDIAFNTYVSSSGNAFQFYKDTTSPSQPTYNTPDWIFVNSSSQLLDVDFQDNVRLKDISYTHDSLMTWWAFVTNHTSPQYTADFNLSLIWANLTPGYHSLDFKVTDWSGFTIINPTTNRFDFYKDVDTPYPAYNTAEGLAYAANPTFDIDFNDVVRLRNVSYKIDSSGSWNAIVTDHANPTYSTNWAMSNPSWSALSEGDHYIYFNITDWAGHKYLTTNNTTAFHFIKDTVKPSSQVDAPAKYWHNTVLQVNATASDPLGLASVALWFRYSADNGTTPWSAWASFGADTAAPWQWSFTWPSGDGYYEFYSIATDNAGNAEDAPGAADATCGCDATPPSSGVDAIDPYLGVATSVVITATASDTKNGIGSVELWYAYSADNATFGAYANFGTDSASPWSWNFNYPNGAGYYAFYSRARDNNVTNYEAAPAASDALCRYDPIGPTSSVDAITPFWTNANPRTITATATAGTGTLTFVTLWYRFRPDNATWGAFINVTSDTTAPYSWSFAWPSGNGYYEFYTTSGNSAGKIEVAPGTPDARAMFDSASPTSSADISGAYGCNAALTISATASDAAPASGAASVELWYRYGAVNGTFGAWTSAGTDSASPWSWSFSFANGQGFYEFYSTATDRAGCIEASPATADIAKMYDSIAPASSCGSLGAYWCNSAPLPITATGADSGVGLGSVELFYRRSADNVTFDAWTSGGVDSVAPWSWSFTFTGGQGRYEFYTVATDRLGNAESAPATADVSCAFDSTPPAVTLAQLPPYVISSVFNVSGSATDAGGGIAYVMFYYTTNGGTTWTALATHYPTAAMTFAATADGNYGFYAVACDLAGNLRALPTATTAPDSSTLVDTTRPTVSGATPSGTEVGVLTNITMAFSEPMNASSVESSMTLPVGMTAVYLWNHQNTTLTMQFNSALPYLTWVNVTLGTGAKDAHGLALGSSKTVTFKTSAQPSNPAQQGGIQGQVLDEDGAPIQGVIVTLGDTGRTTATDANGNYSFADVTAGTYTLEFTCPGYDVESVQATVTAGQDVTSNAALPAAEEGEGAGTYWIPIIVIAVLATVIVVTLCILKAKGKQKEIEKIEEKTEESKGLQ
jgi:hypothetical protein